MNTDAAETGQLQTPLTRVGAALDEFLKFEHPDCLHPARRRGVARNLVATIERWAADRGCITACIWRWASSKRSVWCSSRSY
jgi:GNAT superfamily N-acetyltransferase